MSNYGFAYKSVDRLPVLGASEPLDYVMCSTGTEARKVAPGAMTGISGWVLIEDSEYSASDDALSVASGVRTQITIDGLGSNTNTTYRDSVPAGIWANDALSPTAAGESYQIRLDMQIEQTGTGTGKYFDLQLDIGEAPAEINIVSKTQSLLKGQGNVLKFSASFNIFCLGTFVANDGRFYITPNVAVDIWDAQILINKLYRP